MRFIVATQKIKQRLFGQTETAHFAEVLQPCTALAALQGWLPPVCMLGPEGDIRPKVLEFDGVSGVPASLFEVFPPLLRLRI